MTVRTILLGAFALLVFTGAPDAHAARVSAFLYEEDVRIDVNYYGRLTFTAFKGERNRVSVRTAGSQGRLVVEDAGAPLTPGRGCRRRTRRSAVCTVPAGDGRTLSFRLRDRDDVFTAAAGVTSEVSADGGDGRDRLRARGAGATLHGGDGDDALDGGRGGNRLEGDAGRDVLRGGPGPDVLSGGGGRDRLVGGSGTDTLLVTEPRGGVASDRLVRDTLIDGGPGRDTLDATGTGDDLSIRLGARGSVRSGRSTQAVRDVENADSGYGDDVITGDGARNVIDPGEGEDRVRAGGGNDRITGHAFDPGGDVRCGAGDDTVLFPGTEDLLAADCEGVEDEVRARAQPLAVSADDVTFEFPCRSADSFGDDPVTLSFPPRDAFWAKGPFDTVIATVPRPAAGPGRTCRATFPFSAAAKRRLAADGRLVVSLQYDLIYGWSTTLRT